MALLRSTYLLIACALPVSAFAGTLSNPTLVENSAVAKAQAANTISLFMTTGSQTCDAEGKNCKAAYGANNTMDYASLQQNAQSITGVDAFSFMDKDGSPSTVAVQMGAVVLSCGAGAYKISSGVALKLTDCHVAADGGVTLSYQVCTAPSRNLPVEATANAVPCSTNATDPSYFPPAGKTCMKPACDTEPIGGLNGWSPINTLSWSPNLPANATEATKTANGLGLVFYPPLEGGVPAGFSANSDSMVAVKVLQSALNPDTGAAAVGLKLALRKSSTVTTAMVEAGPVAVANPAEHTSQWANLEKMNTNPLVAQYGAKYSQRGNTCMQQIQSGLEGDGTIYVCDETYDQDGVKPIAHSFQMATDGKECGTSQQCLQKVMNTNTWTSTCESDVPLGMRNCTTTTSYTVNPQKCEQSRTTEVCSEKRKSYTVTCNITSAVSSSAKVTDWKAAMDASLSLLDIGNFRYNHKKINFTLPGTVVAARIVKVYFDDFGEFRVNGHQIVAEYGDTALNLLEDPTEMYDYEDEYGFRWRHYGRVKTSGRPKVARPPFPSLGYYWANYPSNNGMVAPDPAFLPAEETMLALANQMSCAWNGTGPDSRCPSIKLQAGDVVDYCLTCGKNYGLVPVGPQYALVDVPCGDGNMCSEWQRTGGFDSIADYKAAVDALYESLTHDSEYCALFTPSDYGGGYCSVWATRPAMKPTQTWHKVGANSEGWWMAPLQWWAELNSAKTGIEINPSFFIKGKNTLDVTCFDGGEESGSCKIQIEVQMLEDEIIENNGCADYESAK